jgi:geranylgeranyl diphosphate synthase type II
LKKNEGHFMDIIAYLEEKRTLINEALARFVPPSYDLDKTLVEAVRYSIFAGGKRIRPILCMAGSEAAGGSGISVLPFACALEFIHTYSLIHDDLPGMDNDDLRRGVPTCHKKFGEAAAILAGDALLTEAFYLMTDPLLSPNIEPVMLLKAAHMVAEHISHRGMVGGQMVDVESEGKDSSLELVQFIHRKKTAEFIQASVATGAYLAGALGEDLSAFANYGLCLGLAFQIRDDILNVVGESQVMGKSKGSDEIHRKVTYPSAVGMDKALESERNMIREALKSLEHMNSRSDPLKAIALYLLEREH